MVSILITVLKKFDTKFDTKYNWEMGGGGGGENFGTFVYFGVSTIWLHIKIKSLSQQEIQLPRE